MAQAMIAMFAKLSDADMWILNTPNGWLRYDFSTDCFKVVENGTFTLRNVACLFGLTQLAD